MKQLWGSRMPQTRANSMSIKNLFTLRTIAGPFCQCAISCLGTFSSTTKPGNLPIAGLFVCVGTLRTHAILESVLVTAFQTDTQGT